MRTVNGCGSGERPAGGAAEGATRAAGGRAPISQAKGQSLGTNRARAGALRAARRPFVFCEPEPLVVLAFLFAAERKRGL